MEEKWCVAQRRGIEPRRCRRGWRRVGCGCQRGTQIAQAAARAARSRGRIVQSAQVDRPKSVEGEIELGELGQADRGAFGCQSEQTNGFGGLQRRGDGDGGAEHADGVEVSRRVLQRSVRGTRSGGRRLRGKMVSCMPRGCYDAGVDERDGVLDGEVIEEVAGVEIVGAVEDEVGAV